MKHKQKVEDSYDRNPKKETNIDLVNDFLIQIRKNNYEKT